MSGDQNRPMTREERVDHFSERFVDHSEWWEEEMSRVRDVVADILDGVRDRDDVEVAKRGTSVDTKGIHTGTFELKIAGEPWEFSDGEEHTVYRCAGCERVYDRPRDADHGECCPLCGTRTSHEDTEVKTVVF